MVFVAAAGLGGYGLARAALSPVERMRREVASVSARNPAPGLQVPRTRDEIAALATTMNELLGRLQAALARQRALVADASHELRTPFAVLRGELELASRPGRSREELAAAVGPGQRGGRPAGAHHRAAAVPGAQRRGPDPAAPGTGQHRRTAHPQRGARGRRAAARPACRCQVNAPAGLVAERRPRPHP